MSDSIVSVLICLVCSLVVHIAVSWITSAGRFLLKGLAIGAIGALSFAVFRWMAGGAWLLETYVYFSAWIFYMMAFMNLLNSVTLKMLSLLYTAPQFTLDTHSLGTVLNDINGFDSRFDLMEKNGLITAEGNNLELTRQGRLLASMTEFARALLATNAKPENRTG